MGFFLGISRGRISFDVSRNGPHGEEGVVVFVERGTFEFPVDLDAVTLSPLDEFRFEIDVGLGDLFEVDVAGEDAFGDDYSFKNGKCYWSKAATMMLKGEVYLWSGRHMGGGNTDYTTAKNALESVKNANVTLQSNFSRVFAYDNKENSEIIFTIHNGRNEYTMWNDQYRLNMVMNQNFFASYCDENGTPLSQTDMSDMSGLIRYQVEQELYTKLFRDGDTRKGYSIKEDISEIFNDAVSLKRETNHQ